MNLDGDNMRPVPGGLASVGTLLWFDADHFLTVRATDRNSPRRIALATLDGKESPEIPVDGMVVTGAAIGDGNLLIATVPAGGDPRRAVPTLKVIRRDGSLVRTVPVPSMPGRMLGFRPSRDGRQIAFISVDLDTTKGLPDFKSTTLFVTNIDGSNVRSFRVATGLAEQPSWSHDGKRIALQHDHPFERDARGAPVNPASLDADIIIIDITTGVIRELTHPDKNYLDETPDWSPDGRIFIQSNRDGIMEIYRMNADGTAAKRLTR